MITSADCYTVIPPPKILRHFLILKKATRDLNPRTLPFCVQMAQMQTYQIYVLYLLTGNLLKWVLVLCFYLFSHANFSKYTLYFPGFIFHIHALCRIYFVDEKLYFDHKGVLVLHLSIECFVQCFNCCRFS